MVKVNVLSELVDDLDNEARLVVAIRARIEFNI